MLESDPAPAPSALDTIPSGAEGAERTGGAKAIGVGSREVGYRGNGELDPELERMLSEENRRALRGSRSISSS